MRRLKVALIHRDSPRLMAERMVGWWAYPVPQFTWDHFPQLKHFGRKRSDFQGYDLIFYEDGKISGQITRDADIPVAYLVVDSTLSEKHYQARLAQARLNADLVLVDWDRLERFEGLGLPVRRFSYCVNDRLFYDRCLPRQTDVGSFQGGTEDRRKLEADLREWCKQKGFIFATGVMPHEEYALAMSRCKVVINTNRNKHTRGHRLFDALACRTCLLTNPTPDVSGEYRTLNQHYLQYRSWDELKTILEFLIQSDAWAVFADAGHDLVHIHHTWSARAAELREIIHEEFGL